MSDRWMKHFGVKIFIKEIKSISLSHIFHFESEPHILTFLQNLLRVAKKFSHLIANPIAYKMMFLLLLTTESQKMSKFPALQKTYLQMFWRKLNHTFVEKSNCNELVKEIFSAIHHFQLLTDSMLQLLSWEVCFLNKQKTIVQLVVTHYYIWVCIYNPWIQNHN